VLTQLVLPPVLLATFFTALFTFFCTVLPTFVAAFLVVVAAFLVVDRATMLCGRRRAADQRPNPGRRLPGLPCSARKRCHEAGRGPARREGRREAALTTEEAARTCIVRLCAGKVW
jgi:hypothetical protein